jgi:hypothetical protein
MLEHLAALQQLEGIALVRPPPVFDRMLIFLPWMSEK